MEEKNEPALRPQTAEGRYELLEISRQPVLQMAREVARLTIPALMPPEQNTAATLLPQPYQSTGADGVNNLAAKLLLALFPPGASFVRLTMDDYVVEKLKAAAGGGKKGEDARAMFEEALAKVERALMNRIEQTGSRTVDFEALRHLIATGNGLLFIDKRGKQKFFPLDRYVVSRDLEGNVLEIVVKESLAKEALPKKVREFLQAQPVPEGEKEKPETESIDLFTWVKRQDSGSWTVQQEVAGEIIPGSTGTYPKDRSAWLALRWTTVPGEPYGRGRCEEYLGDLRSLESLCQSVIEFAAASSKILFLVAESGVTQAKVLQEADSGDFVEGDAKDVTVLRLDKGQDFQVAFQVMEGVKQRLERAFLMASSVQRNAERVTAEEIRAMINELEQGLGGVYSNMAEEFQRPLVMRVMHQMQLSKELPHLPDGAVSPQIVTGLEGLGRNSDLQRLDALLRGCSEQFGPEMTGKYVKAGAYMKRRGAALGIDLSGLLRSEEEVQASQQQQQMAEMAGKLGPQTIKAVSDQAQAQAPAEA